MLATLTLPDVFDTVMVPGGSSASLKVAKRIAWLFLPASNGMRRKREV